MGIISPNKGSAVSRAIIILLLISFSPILIGALVLYLLWGLILSTAIWLTWRTRFVVFVYSDSPTWKDYIEREFLPQIQDQAMILNWSERRKWKNSLAVMAFRYFGGYKNFNPMGIVFRPFHFVKTYRFFEAFKHNNFQRVAAVWKALLDDLGSDRSSRR
jgi:hypothetical protein